MIRIVKEKVIGYSLLTLGILIIFYTAGNVYSVFTKKQNPTDVFNLPGISLDLSGLVGGDLSPEERALMKEKNINTKAELISPEVLNTPLNYTFHILFMGFIASIGFKIANLGTLMVRPIRVNLKEEKSVLLPSK